MRLFVCGFGFGDSIVVSTYRHNVYTVSHSKRILSINILYSFRWERKANAAQNVLSLPSRVYVIVVALVHQTNERTYEAKRKA